MWSRVKTQLIFRWEKYLSIINPRDDLAFAEKSIPTDELDRHFPFHAFFADAPQPLFKGNSFAEDFEIAQSCWRYIQVRKKMFSVIYYFFMRKIIVQFYEKSGSSNFPNRITSGNYQFLLYWTLKWTSYYFMIVHCIMILKTNSIIKIKKSNVIRIKIQIED